MHELVARYKNLPLALRAVVCMTLGAVGMWFFHVSDEFNTVESKYQSSEEQRESLSSQAKSMQKKLENLNEEELREEIENLQKDYEQAQTVMPKKFVIDDVLAYVSKAATQSGVTLISFQPREPNEKGEDFRYYEQTIELNIEGNYRQSGYFFDLISRMETMVHIRDIKMSQFQKKTNERSTDRTSPRGEEDEKKNMLERLSIALSKYQVKSQSTMVVFSAS